MSYNYSDHDDNADYDIEDGTYVRYYSVLCFNNSENF